MLYIPAELAEVEKQSSLTFATLNEPVRMLQKHKISTLKIQQVKYASHQQLLNDSGLPSSQIGRVRIVRIVGTVAVGKDAIAHIAITAAVVNIVRV